MSNDADIELGLSLVEGSEIKHPALSQLVTEAFSEISSAMNQKNGELAAAKLQEHYEQIVNYLNSRSGHYLEAVSNGTIKMDRTGEPLIVDNEEIRMRDVSYMSNVKEKIVHAYWLDINGNDYKANFGIQEDHGRSTLNLNFEEKEGVTDNYIVEIASTHDDTYNNIDPNKKVVTFTHFTRSKLKGTMSPIVENHETSFSGKVQILQNLLEIPGFS